MGSDKFVHIRSFLIITLIALFLFRKYGGKLSDKKKIVLALVCSITMGVGDEIIQIWLPGRTSDVKDLVANLIGIGAGLLLFLIYRQIKKNGCG